MDQEEYIKLKDYALKFLSFRPRSKKELQGKLLQYAIKKGISQKAVDRVLTDLSNQNFINDEDFIKWWVDQRRSFKPKGERAVIIELTQKGIERDLIKKVLSGGDKQNEYDLAVQAIKKKINTYKYLSEKEIKIKIGNFLSRRGFDYDIIYKVIDSLHKKSYNSNT